MRFTLLDPSPFQEKQSESKTDRIVLPVSKVVDYIDVFPGTPKRTTPEERERIVEFAQRIKEVAQEFGVVFVLKKG